MKPAGWYYLTAAQCQAISSSIENMHMDREGRPDERAALAAEKVVLGPPLRLPADLHRSKEIS